MTLAPIITNGAGHEVLLATKLYIPQPRPNLVSRPYLVARLNNSVQSGCKLTLISAPPGFGKTTLLSEWLPLFRFSNSDSQLDDSQIENRHAPWQPVPGKSQIQNRNAAWLSLDAIYPKVAGGQGKMIPRNRIVNRLKPMNYPFRIQIRNDRNLQ